MLSRSAVTQGEEVIKVGSLALLARVVSTRLKNALDTDLAFLCQTTRNPSFKTAKTPEGGCVSE